MQVKQFLEDTKRYLTQMLRTINIKDEVQTLKLLTVFIFTQKLVA